MKNTNIHAKHKELTGEYYYLREALEYPEAHTKHTRKWYKKRFDKVWEELKNIVYNNPKLCLDLP